ncbi:VacJ family lipoprotein [Sphingomonas sp. SUN019]|uniref:MlaA family lipoprotein n=1 Tax=Sphingomonas sp. SUN019 TaxID=2937788 RepID=UPI0021646DB6|nr:VacJ family lipoprotein [Sphingomonas sp. SUN019]UVO52129.1 VacJ family lipoprotein [Sphingomonas sp. SUN019]
MIATTTAILMAGTFAQTGASPPPTITPPPISVTIDPVPPVATIPPVEATPEPATPLPPVVQPIDLPVPPIAKADSQTDVVVVGKRDAAGDPLISVNAKAFGATQAVDRAFVGPVSLAYKRSIPSPIRSGIHNFLYNLREPIVFVNFLLQFKVGKAAETAGRFAINSTVGAAGLIDIAKRKPFRLPRRSNGFANTLGFHGVKNGPFLFLPLVGPTTVRDLIGGTIDRLFLPVAVGKPFTSTEFTAPAGALGALDHRAEFDETLKCLHDDSTDPYTSSRAFYLERRQAEIDHLKGRVRKTTPRCETVGFGIGSTPPAAGTSAPAKTSVQPPAATTPSMPVDTSSGVLPEVSPPTPIPADAPAPPVATSPVPAAPPSDPADRPIVPPVNEDRITEPR